MTSLHSLLARGFFPRELPPPFTTESFANVIDANASSLPQSFTSHKKLNAKLADHSTARVGILRRRLNLPNPVAQYNLCREISDNWVKLSAFWACSHSSKSIPKLGPSHGRALLPAYGQADLSPLRSRIRATSRYILKTDISKFYPSIYTHSIPWAFHGKSYAKNNKNSNILGNSLDKWLRCGQDGQTIGIPIGPDSSLVIAEILLCKLDENLALRVPSINFMRYVDDIEIGFTTYAEAQGAFSVLQELLRDYELEPNLGKTKIITLPEPLDSAWSVELRDFKFRSSKQGQMSDLTRYFGHSYRLSRAYPEDYVLKYAAERLRSTNLHISNWDIVQDFLLNCIMVETGTIVSSIRRLIQFHTDGYPVDLSLVERVLNFQISSQCPFGHGNEVAWSIWAMIYWNITISDSAAKALSKMSDSVVALLALDAYQRGLIPNGLDTSLWESYLDTPELYGKQWLLSYEANIKGWLPSSGSADHVAADHNFAWLKSLGVSFYDPLRIDDAVPTGASVGGGLAPVFSFPQ